MKSLVRDPQLARSINAWISVSTDHRITILVDRAEMGQGVMTSLAMLVAEELDVDLGQVSVAFATGRSEYVNPIFNVQITAASTSVRLGWLPLRLAGAAARARFVEAAARIWEVDPDLCRTEHGVVISPDGERRLRYGDLVGQIAPRPSRTVKLKELSDFKLIGKPLARVDGHEKITGSACYGIDVSIPGLLTSVIIRPPRIGARLRSFDASSALCSPGVREVFPVSNGVAIIADSFWHALRAREDVRVDWSEPGYKLDSDQIEKGFREAIEKSPTKIVRSDGKYKKTLGRGNRILSAVYEVPYLAHTPLEPMNCTADVRPERCTIWAPTQNPEGARLIAAEITGLRRRAIEVNVVYMGGSFGRRQEVDFVVDAVEASMGASAPVKVIWPREDDFAHDRFRPMAVCRLEAVIDREDTIVGWHHRIVSTSLWKNVAPMYGQLLYLRWMPLRARRLIGSVISRFVRLQADPNLAEGAVQMPYKISNVQVEYVEHDPGVSVGAWRSVGHAYNVFAIESFIDELAAANSEDPYDFRLGLLKEAPQLQSVLKLAAERTPWNSQSGPDIGRGIALYDYEGTSVAMVAEVLTEQGGPLRIRRIVCAVNCGIVVNPDDARAQVEGAIASGLAATLKGRITFRNNVVEQSNLDTYEPLQLSEMPPIDVYFEENFSPPTGLGEAATPGVAPAICNAVFAATGRRMRRLPLDWPRLSVQQG